MPAPENAKSGREARKRAPRSSQATWEPGPERRSPAEVLAEQDKTRIPELVPVRYGRMLASAFTFYRGAALIMGLLSEYRGTLDDQARVLVERYHYIDAAHKVVGVGSVGTRAWITLLLGRNESDPLFLQMKEAGASVLEPFAGASRFRQYGHRVVAGQRLMQAAGDVLLGWLTVEGLDGKKQGFYVRQLWDGKGSAEIEAMGPETMAGYAELCGWSLARAHARSGDRAAIAAYLGKGDSFDQAIAEFAEAYADQNEADYEALLEAERSGQLKVERGV